MQDNDSAWRSPFGRILIGSVAIAVLAGFASAAGALDYLKRWGNDDRSIEDPAAQDAVIPGDETERVGVAEGAATPLLLMIATSDRQTLENGGEMLALSGRVVNPTDRDLKIPPIRAELRNKQTQMVVHRWAITPPTDVLPARGSATFNSTEFDIPTGGDELTVTLEEGSL